MEVLLAVVREVKIVGDQSWWAENAGSIVLAFAAISAAGLAAFVSIWNTRRQLAHDRELRHFDHIRDTIDAAFSMAADAVKAASLATTQVKLTEERRDSRAGLEAASAPGEFLEVGVYEAEDAESELRSRDRNLNSILGDMSPMKARLEVRLGKGDQITGTFASPLDALLGFYDHLEPAVRRNRPASDREEDEDAADVVIAAFRDFRTACYRWFKGS